MFKQNRVPVIELVKAVTFVMLLNLGVLRTLPLRPQLVDGAYCLKSTLLLVVLLQMRTGICTHNKNELFESAL